MAVYCTMCTFLTMATILTAHMFLITDSVTSESVDHHHHHCQDAVKLHDDAHLVITAWDCRGNKSWREQLDPLDCGSRPLVALVTSQTDSACLLLRSPPTFNVRSRRTLNGRSGVRSGAIFNVRSGAIFNISVVNQGVKGVEDASSVLCGWCQHMGRAGSHLNCVVVCNGSIQDWFHLQNNGAHKLSGLDLKMKCLDAHGSLFLVVVLVASCNWSLVEEAEGVGAEWVHVAADTPHPPTVCVCCVCETGMVEHDVMEDSRRSPTLRRLMEETGGGERVKRSEPFGQMSPFSTGLLIFVVTVIPVVLCGTMMYLCCLRCGCRKGGETLNPVLTEELAEIRVIEPSEDVRMLESESVIVDPASQPMVADGEDEGNDTGSLEVESEGNDPHAATPKYPVPLSGTGDSGISDPSLSYSELVL